MKTKNSRPPRPKHRYDWRPDLPDQRDFLYAAYKPAVPKLELPKSIDLREKCSAVQNQGKIGSCTGNALAGALEFLQLQALADDIDDRTQAMVFAKNRFAALSRLFIYYNERALEGTTDQDSGAMLRDGIKALVQWGACKESAWKYSETNLFRKPPASAYSQAKPHCISSYLRLQGLDDMKQCLASGFPFAFGFAVYESFESPEVARTGIMPMPKLSERFLGGHAVLAVGYEDRSKRMIVRNSWGSAWGKSGYFWMPYAYIENPMLSRDFWTIRQ